MKTIEQASKEYACITEDKYHNKSLCHSPYDMVGAFAAGVEFAQRWISVEYVKYGYLSEKTKQDMIENVPFILKYKNGFLEIIETQNDIIDFTGASIWRPIEFK